MQAAAITTISTITIKDIEKFSQLLNILEIKINCPSILSIRAKYKAFLENGLTTSAKNILMQQLTNLLRLIMQKKLTASDKQENSLTGIESIVDLLNNIIANLHSNCNDFANLGYLFDKPLQPHQVQLFKLNTGYNKIMEDNITLTKYSQTEMLTGVNVLLENFCQFFVNIRIGELEKNNIIVNINFDSILTRMKLLVEMTKDYPIYNENKEIYRNALESIKIVTQIYADFLEIKEELKLANEQKNAFDCFCSFRKLHIAFSHFNTAPFNEQVPNSEHHDLVAYCKAQMELCAKTYFDNLFVGSHIRYNINTVITILAEATQITDTLSAYLPSLYPIIILVKSLILIPHKNNIDEFKFDEIKNVMKSFPGKTESSRFHYITNFVDELLEHSTKEKDLAINYLLLAVDVLSEFQRYYPDFNILNLSSSITLFLNKTLDTIIAIDQKDCTEINFLDTNGSLTRRENILIKQYKFFADIQIKLALYKDNSYILHFDTSLIEKYLKAQIDSYLTILVNYLENVYLQASLATKGSNNSIDLDNLLNNNPMQKLLAMEILKNFKEYFEDSLQQLLTTKACISYCDKNFKNAINTKYLNLQTSTTTFFQPTPLNKTPPPTKKLDLPGNLQP